jgi:hypothetical protein
MNTLSSARVSAFSPLSIGIFVAGMLMFVVIAIVRSVTSQGSDIDTTTAAGLSSIQAPSVSNNVAGSLPSFQPAPVAIATGLPDFYPTAVPVKRQYSGQMTQEEWVAALGVPEFKVIDGQNWVGIAPDTNLAASGWWPCNRVQELGVGGGLPALFKEQIYNGCGLPYVPTNPHGWWDNHTWGAVGYQGTNNDKWIWGGAWFDCQHIDPDALTYVGMGGGDPVLAVWGKLAPRRQSELAKECGR